MFAAIAFTDDPHLSDGVRFAATLTIWVSLILAVAFAIRGFVNLWNMSNARLSLQPTGTITIGGGNQYVPFPLLRLKFENKETPGDFLQVGAVSRETETRSRGRVDAPSQPPRSRWA